MVLFYIIVYIFVMYKHCSVFEDNVHFVVQFFGGEQLRAAEKFTHCLCVFFEAELLFGNWTLMNISRNTKEEIVCLQAGFDHLC